MGWGVLRVWEDPDAARDPRPAGKPLPLLSLVMVTVLPTAGQAARHGMAQNGTEWHGMARNGDNDGALGTGTEQ